MRTANGSIHQSGLMSNPMDYTHNRLGFPVIGVIIALHFSDDPDNTSAVTISDQRGSYCTADVLCLNVGTDDVMIIHDVIVLPPGPSGVDDFCEELPKPCTQMIDGSTFDISAARIDPLKLDGDWCVVAFVGGSISTPIMLKWFPHPGNRCDPATFGWPIQTQNGNRDAKTLNQGRRSFRRYAGLKATITSEGSLFVDTNESNSTFEGSKSGPKRNKRDAGGDIQVDVKPSRQFEINFNEPVPLPNTQPSLPQPNPPQGEQQRKTDRTTVTLSKDDIRLLAGAMVEILTSDGKIDMHAKTKVSMRGDDGNNSVILGDTDPTNCDHAIKGETFRQLFNALINWAENHTHPTSVGPTDKPTAPFGQTMTDTQLSLPVMVKK